MVLLETVFENTPNSLYLNAVCPIYLFQCSEYNVGRKNEKEMIVKDKFSKQPIENFVKISIHRRIEDERRRKQNNMTTQKNRILGQMSSASARDHQILFLLHAFERMILHQLNQIYSYEKHGLLCLIFSNELNIFKCPFNEYLGQWFFFMIRRKKKT